MRIETKEVRDKIKVLDDLVQKYKQEHPEKKRDWKTYEQRVAERMREAIRALEPLIDEAIASIHIVRGDERGRKPELSLKQKTILLLLKHLFGKSNREMSCMLVLFSLLAEVDVSYKTIERLYSDEEVLMVLHNMHMLLLKKKEVNDPDCSGDGTGSGLTIKKHYATEAQKLKEAMKDEKTLKKKTKSKKKMFVYTFKFMDLKSRMYLAYGTSFRSEKEAFLQALTMTEKLGIKSIRLDRYYSGQSCVKLLKEKFKKIKIYLIPKKNVTLKGPWAWKRMLHEFVNDTEKYLSEYFRRNQSESGFSEDKNRLGWTIAQRRPDRIDTADFCTLIWHNLFWLG